MRRSKWHRYSITRSADTSSPCGIANPSASAVLRLMTRSNLVGCSTEVAILCPCPEKNASAAMMTRPALCRAGKRILDCFRRGCVDRHDLDALLKAGATA